MCESVLKLVRCNVLCMFTGTWIQIKTCCLMFEGEDMTWDYKYTAVIGGKYQRVGMGTKSHKNRLCYVPNTYPHHLYHASMN